MSRFPVRPAPPVPAAAPIKAPIAAPFPPPATAPIAAPPPAPPPTMTAVRLPLPLVVHARAEVCTSCSLPPKVMEVSSSSSTAPPLNRPAAFASFTIPEARAPLGIATLPSISTGASTVATNLWPVVLIFDPTASSRTTEIDVSAGTTIGLGFGAASLFADAELDGEDDAVSEEAGWLADLAQPASTIANDKRDSFPAKSGRFIDFLRIYKSFF